MFFKKLPKLTLTNNEDRQVQQMSLHYGIGKSDLIKKIFADGLRAQMSNFSKAIRPATPPKGPPVKPTPKSI
jgi:hypothetical protein